MKDHKIEFEQDLQNICQSLYSSQEEIQIAPEEIQEFQKNLIVVLPCGGESKRMGDLAQDKPKSLLSLPGGDTLLSRMIRMYAKQGAKEFVLLVGKYKDCVKESIDPLFKEITIKYSPDPVEFIGRGGAVLYAIEQKYIPEDSCLIIHNADDQIANYNDNFFHDICKAHLIAEKKGACATVIVARWSSYAYTAMKIEKGIVVGMASKCQIPIPAHIGVSILNSDAQKRFKALFNYKEKKDFEEHLFPILMEERKLHAFGIPGNTWYAINTPKEYEVFKKLCETH